MDLSGSRRVPFIPRQESSFSFMYNYSNYEPIPVMEMDQLAAAQQGMLGLDKIGGMNLNYGQDPKKKRLSNEQLELLENSFQEEVKLDPDRKLKLAKELGMQPRQIAIWFQNRRARWKAKQLERLYDALKQEYDAVLRDKRKLHQEVLALRAILKEQLVKKTVNTTEKLIAGDQMPLCDAYELNVDGYNHDSSAVMPPPYWQQPPQLPSGAREVVDAHY